MWHKPSRPNRSWYKSARLTAIKRKEVQRSRATSTPKSGRRSQSQEMRQRDPSTKPASTPVARQNAIRLKMGLVMKAAGVEPYTLKHSM
jgi:hypothetical protein